MSRSFYPSVAVLLFFLFPQSAMAQLEMRGRVVSDDNNAPVAYASIGIKNKEAGCVADSTGNFVLTLPAFVKSTDSVIISSIGYERTGFVVYKFRTMKDFKLKNANQNLNNVIVSSHFKEMKFGNAKDETFLFFRAWNAKGTGGEIGQVVEVPYNSFTINRVLIKMDNKYDTCWVRLHIRAVNGEQPGEELLNENVIRQVYTTNSTNQIEFDLTGKNPEINSNKVFVGFEVLDCRSADGMTHSVCFVGNEYGQHTFKPFVNSKWEYDAMFSISIKMLLKY